MAIVDYPSQVPKPLISISRTQAQTFQLVQPLRGPGYVKRLNNDAPVTYDLTWRMTRDQAAQFQTWFYSMSASGLAMGRNQFQLEVDTEFGKLLHTLQLTPDTFSQTQEAHNVFSYQATAIARKVPIPQWWLDHGDLVNSEFFPYRDLFDIVMNKQITESPIYAERRIFDIVVNEELPEI